MWSNARDRPVRWMAGAAVALLLASGCAAGSDTTEAGAGSNTTSTASPVSSGAGSTTGPATTTPAGTTTTTPVSTTAPVPTTSPAQAGAPAGLTSEEGDLQAGSKGLRTFVVQKALKALHFDAGEPDGAFGLKTTMAVWAYQAIYGLPVTGVVSPIIEASILLAKPAPMLRPDLGPTHTEVDLDKQVLLVFRDGALQLVTHVSTGSGRHYCNKGSCGTAITTLGDFRYQRRISGWRVAPLGRLYNPIYFNGGIAVHGAPSVPDHPASHGCVRIPMHIAEYFPSLVRNGDPISVFHGGVGGATPAPAAPPGANQAPPPDALAGD